MFTMTYAHQVAKLDPEALKERLPEVLIDGEEIISEEFLDAQVLFTNKRVIEFAVRDGKLANPRSLLYSHVVGFSVEPELFQDGRMELRIWNSVSKDVTPWMLILFNDEKTAWAAQKVLASCVLV